MYKLLGSIFMSEKSKVDSATKVNLLDTYTRRNQRLWKRRRQLMRKRELQHRMNF